MKKRLLKIAVALSLAATVLFSLCGCGLDIELRETIGEDGWVFNDLNIRLPTTLADKLEANASSNGTDKWTLDGWLKAYMDAVSDMYDFTFEYDASYDSGGVKRFHFDSIAVKRKPDDDYLTEALSLKGESKVKKGFFIHRINVVRDDRFNWWIKEFDDAYEHFVLGVDDPSDHTTLMGIILFGCGYYMGDPLEYVEILPGFTDAFPAAEFDTYTQTALHDLWYASSKMNVSSNDRIPGKNKYVYYVFDKKASDGDTSVEYEYYRANPTGWYLIAILAGGAVVGAIFLGCYLMDKKKAKPPKVKTEDLFPYDPFAE